MEMDLHHLRSRSNTAPAQGPGLGPGPGLAHGQGLGAGRHGPSRIRAPSPRLGAARCR